MSPPRSTAKKSAPTNKSTAKKGAPTKKTAAKESTPARKAAPKTKAAAKKAAPTKRATPKKPAETVEEPVAVIEPDLDDDLWSDDWDDPWDDDWDDVAPGPDATRTAASGPASHLAGDGAEMFQRAALELIAAARTALDAAEELVNDPALISASLESLRDLASDAVRGARAAARPTAGWHDDADDDDDDFQSIRVEDD